VSRRVLAALEETGQLDNTLVIFTSDNGYLWGEHGLGDKRAAYEESIRIPWVMRYPKLIRAGAALDDAVLDIDLAPTLLELAGAPAPKPLHGRSLVPLLRGQHGGWRRVFLAEYFAETQFPRVATWKAVRAEGWKYIHYRKFPVSRTFLRSPRARTLSM
jgi:arylsulfatase A-like enzyme